MTEYSAQPNLQGEQLPLFGLSPRISAMPKKGPYGKRAAPIRSETRLVNLKKWRLFRKMTVADLAEAAQMSAGNVSDMENLRQGYSPESLARLAKALKITTSELLSVDPMEPKTAEFWPMWEAFNTIQRAQLTDIAKTFPPEPEPSPEPPDPARPKR